MAKQSAASRPIPVAPSIGPDISASANPKTFARAWPGLVTVVAVALLMACTVVGFIPVFGVEQALTAAGIGSLCGLLVGAVGHWRKWGFLITMPILVVIYYLFGGPCALPSTTIGGWLPTLDTLLRLTVLSAQSWRDLLTVTAPASAFVGPAIVPWLGCLLIATVATRLALARSRWSWLGVILPAFSLLIAALWGIREAPTALILGSCYVFVAVCWLSWRQQHDRQVSAADVQFDRKNTVFRGWTRGIAAVVLIGFVLTSGTVLAPTITESPRLVLRELIEPPLDMRQYPSPLTAFRRMEKDQKEQTLFTVSELPKGSRIRLAAMDRYDGWVYSVDQDSAHYVRIGNKYNPAKPAPGTVSSVSVTIKELSGNWIPANSDIRGVTFRDQQGKTLAKPLYLNQLTTTLLTTEELGKDINYSVDVVWVPEKKVDQIGKADVQPIRMPLSRKIPEVIGTFTNDTIGEANSPIARLTRIEEKLSKDGYYSNGTERQSRPGHSAERIARMLTAPELVGDDEQYAVAMALMARSLGIPARVVMGFYPDEKKRPPDGEVQITGEMAHVWVEVPFKNHGWVIFDPTPSRDRIPKTDNPQPRNAPQAQVQPPVQPPKEELQPPTDLNSDKNERKKPKENWALKGLLLYIAMGLGVLILVALPFALVIIYKGVRQWQRRNGLTPAQRIAGGWAEVVDTAVDLGAVVNSSHTRRELATDLNHVFPDAAIPLIASGVDQAAFGPVEPDDAWSSQIWESVENSVQAMRAAVGRKKALAGRIALRSVKYQWKLRKAR